MFFFRGHLLIEARSLSEEDCTKDSFFVSPNSNEKPRV